MKYAYEIEKQTNPLGRDYYSVLKIPIEGGQIKNLGDFESLREAKRIRIWREKNEYLDALENKIIYKEIKEKKQCQ